MWEVGHRRCPDLSGSQQVAGRSRYPIYKIIYKVQFSLADRYTRALTKPLTKIWKY